MTTIILEGSICFKTAKDYPQHDIYLCQSVCCIVFMANVLKFALLRKLDD